MANVELHFFAANDLNGATILEISDEDDFFESLELRIALDELGSGKFILSRQVGFALFDSGAVQPEVFVRVLIPAISTTEYVWGFFLEQRFQQVISTDEAGGENFIFGGLGPKFYLSRAALWPEQFVGAGWHIDLANGVFRWKETATAGRVLNGLINEDAANTTAQFLPDLTKSFNDSDDSNSDPWANDLAGSDEFELPIGQSFLEDLWAIEAAGELETTIHLGTVAAPLFRLDAWQAFGRDLTGAIGAATVHFTEAVNIVGDLAAVGMPLRKASHVIVRGMEGVYAIAERSTWDPGEYAKVAYIEHSITKNVNVLERFGLRWLRKQDNGEREIQLEISPGFAQSSGLYFPGPTGSSGHFWIGDTVSLTTQAGAMGGTPLDYSGEDQRVMAIRMVLDEAAVDTDSTTQALSWHVIPELNVERASSTAPSEGSGSNTTGQTGCNCPALCHPTVEGTPDTLVKYYSGGSDDAGGDAINWAGILQNQGSAGEGGGGSNAYFFKSNAPDHYQDSWAAVAGATYFVTGYIGCTSDGIAQIAFTSAAPGTAGSGLAASIISTHDLTVAQPGHSHSPEWSAFTSNSFVAPVGTTSAALTRDGAFDGDEFRIWAAGTPGSNPYNGTDSRAARCDHVHPASEIVFTPAGTVQSDNVQDAIEEVAEEAATALADLTLDDLSDVDAVAPVDGDVLTWDATNEEWVPAAGTPSSGTFLTVTGGEQHNVSIVSDAGAALELDLADGNVFEITLTEDCEISATGFTAGKWCEGAVLVHQDGTGGWVLIYDTPFEIPSGGSTLPTTADTTSGFGFGSLDGGTTIYWWALGSSGGATDLDDLSDVTITAPAEGDMLRFDGSVWVNTPGRWEPVTTNPGGGPELVWDGDEILMTWVDI